MPNARSNADLVIVRARTCEAQGDEGVQINRPACDTVLKRRQRHGEREVKVLADVVTDDDEETGEKKASGR